jgi:hypothetical protein
MSALLPKADIGTQPRICAKSGHRRFYSITSLACARSRWRNRYAKGLGRLEVNHRLELGRRPSTAAKADI